MKHARHGRDLALDPGTVDHEHRLDEVSGRHLVLAHQSSERGGPPEPAGTADREIAHGMMQEWLENSKRMEFTWRATG